MKIDRRRRAALTVSLLSLVAFTNALTVKNPDTSSDLAIDESSKQDIQSAERVAEVKAKIPSDPKPYDGKDGMPHDGPWIETSAERERKKKTKSSSNNSDDEDEDDGNSEKKSDSKLSKSYEEGLKVKNLPQSNEGVMDDPHRKSPVEGTRGLEGGISEKSKTKETTSDPNDKVKSNRPDPPKEQPPLPHSENLKIQGKEDVDDDESDGSTIDAGEKPKESKKLLEKPTDLPSVPYTGSHPESPSLSKEKDNLPHYESDPLTGTTSPKLKFDTIADSAVIQPLHSLVLSFTMILFSEIGDKTFLVACLMAMRHDRILVFTAAFSALITMTVLSAVLGHAVPTLIPKSITNFLAAGLFLVFGIKMLLEARKISPDEGVSEEMREVEMELEEKEHAAQRRMSRHHRTSSNLVTPYSLESGRKLPSPPSSPSSASSSRSNSPSGHGRHGTGRGAVKTALSGLNNLLSLLLSPAWVQTFVMTFLGEWGDRSQIATIAMAAGQDYWWVTAGALGGHAICTGVAVVGGKAIAGRVSLRTVTMGGAGAFLVFGVIYLAEAVW